ncbi:hypothetical protein FKM82_000645 [Ascaphus truei]
MLETLHITKLCKTTSMKQLIWLSFQSIKKTITVFLKYCMPSTFCSYYDHQNKSLLDSHENSFFELLSSKTNPLKQPSHLIFL